MKQSKFASLPINSKLRRLQGMTVGLALIFTLSVTSITEVWQQRSQILADISSTANMIGFNVAAALLFNDARSANDLLASLRNKPAIIAARLYNLEGVAFADYVAEPYTLTLPADFAEARQQEQRHNDSWLVDHKVIQDIRQNNDVIGHLYLAIDLRPMWWSVVGNLGQISLVTLIAFLLSLYYGKGLSALIAAPLIRLSSLAQQVSREKNYAVRAEGGGEDEVGQLVNSFNSMIEQVQERDAILEQQRDRLEDEVESRTAALREAVKEAQAASVAKSQFLANMSHEIRTPMNGVLGMTELLLGTELNSTQKQYAETVFNSADSLLTIINDILDFSKIEAGKMDLEEIDFNLSDLCEQLTALFFERAQQKHIDLNCELDPDVEHEVRGDPYRLRQVLTNLLSNALKFTEIGSVKLQVSQAGADALATGADVHLRFRISDTGIGVPAEAMSRLFKSFSQADGSTTRKYGGTGLGLIISKELCDLMGGTIDVVSTPNAGTVFTVEIPLRKALEPVPVAATHYSDLAGKSVLIIDDNSTNTDIIANYLSSFGMHYRVAENAAQGLEVLDQVNSSGRHFDVALLDMAMRDMSGAELCRHIRQDSGLADMRLLIVSSGACEDELERIHASGCDLYLDKPLRKRDLQAAFRKLLAKKSANKPIQGCLSGIRVLLAEDNPVNQKLAMAMLGVFGCQVATASDGLEAVDIFKQGKIDLVLMDCMMPNQDGYSASREIRNFEQAGAKQPIPILALTANAMEGDRERCLAAGMNDYLSKPFLLEVFRDKISRLLDIHSPSRVNESTTQPPRSIQFDPAPLATLRKMGGDRLVDDLLQLFYDSVPPLLEKLEQGMVAGDLEAVRHAAHSLKSATANLGALHFADLARDMEHAARNGSLVFDDQQLVKLNNEYRDICEIIAKQDRQSS